MSNTWTSSTLGNVGRFQAGYGFPTKYQGKETGDLPFAKVGDISATARLGKTYIKSAGNYVDRSELLLLKAKTIPEGSIVFAKIGEAIRQNFRAIAAQEMLIDNNSMALIPDLSKVDVGYLYHFMCQLDLYQFTGATTVPAIRKSTLEEIDIPLPPLSEQQRIAAILDKADALRRKRQQAIDLADQFLRSLFLDMFGDPVTNPKGWPVVPFQECLNDKPRNGLSPSTSGTVPGRVLTLSAITRSKFDPAASKEVMFAKEPTESQRVNKNDLLICRGNGNVALVGCGRVPTVTDEHTAFPDTMIAARVNPERITMQYLEYLWNGPAVREHIETNARTTNGTFKVNQGVVNTAPIMLPPIELQGGFQSLLDKTKSTINRQADGQMQADALFNSLSQQAFQGEL